jgi:hypothetical protein
VTNPLRLNLSHEQISNICKYRDDHRCTHPRRKDGDGRCYTGELCNFHMSCRVWDTYKRNPRCNSVVAVKDQPGLRDDRVKDGKCHAHCQVGCQYKNYGACCCEEECADKHDT